MKLSDPGHRFWSKVAEDGDCWAWTGARSSRGYGSFRMGRSTAKAHRVSYAALVGEIPAGLELDHLCRNTSCVNPSHLDPVSHAENVRRGRGGEYWAAKTQCPHGHAFDAENTRIDGRGSRVCRACANERCRRYYRRTKHEVV